MRRAWGVRGPRSWIPSTRTLASPVARLPWQADDIDGVTYLDEPLAPGTLVEVAAELVVDDYDFRAAVVRVIDTPAVYTPEAIRRQLPLVSTTIGSFGR